jgi:hypothetical protein
MTTTTVNNKDVEHLAERLLARARSRISNDPPALQADLLLAGKLLTRWCRDSTDLGVPFSLDDD